MRWSLKDLHDLELAEKMSADVLAEAVKVQAERSVFSEAQCTELSKKYAKAAKTARRRRSVSMDDYCTRNSPVINDINLARPVEDI